VAVPGIHSGRCGSTDHGQGSGRVVVVHRRKGQLFGRVASVRRKGQLFGRVVSVRRKGQSFGRVVSVRNKGQLFGRVVSVRRKGQLFGRVVSVRRKVGGQVVTSVRNRTKGRVAGSRHNQQLSDERQRIVKQAGLKRRAVDTDAVTLIQRLGSASRFRTWPCCAWRADRPMTAFRNGL
jgi:hypothetical protein